MSLYNFSSTDPEHYNRIRVNIPNHFLSRFVNICVSTFVSNCNIEVMNEEDYIEFEIGGVRTKVFMERQSKLDSSSLPQFLQDLFDKQYIRITVFINAVDLIQFVSEEPFSITDMSYNMKLILGFYCVEDDKFPIKSVEFEDEVSVIERENKPLTDIEFSNIDVCVGEYLPILPALTPEDAYGYTIEYINPDENSCVIDENGYIQGLTKSQTKITAKVRNPDSSEYMKPDFEKTFYVIVNDRREGPIYTVSVPKSLTIIENESSTVFPTISPAGRIYSEEWESLDTSIATVFNGYVKGIKRGETEIKYTLTNKYKIEGEEEKEEVFNRTIKVIIRSQYDKVKKQRILSDSVGYRLSTPVLYLLTNIGNHVFFNEMNNQRKLQCGTVCMCLSNSYSPSFPIISQQGEIITKCALNHASDIFFILVDANMREVKLLNPMYITVSIRPDESEPTITPGLLQ